MKAAFSIVLAALLIILPVEQVLAQAEQQEAVSVQQTAPSDGAARLFRVPPLTENSARLLSTSSERSLVPEALNPGVDELVQVPTTPESRLIRPIVAVLVVIVVVIVVLNRLSKGR